MPIAARLRASAIAFLLLFCTCGENFAFAAGMPSHAPMPRSASAVPPAAAKVARVAGTHDAAVRGRNDYATYCAPCHGLLGQGDGPLAPLLVPRPARHSDTAFMNTLSDEYLFHLLKEGGPARGKSALMGAWGRILSAQQIRDLIAYLRVLAQQGG